MLWRRKSDDVQAPREVKGAANRRSKSSRSGRVSAADALVPPVAEEKPVQKETARRERVAKERKERIKVTPPVERVQAPPEPEPIIPVRREPIPTPDDAPQIGLKNGVPVIVKNAEIITPMFFFGAATDEVRVQTVLEQVKLAKDDGIHNFIHLVELEVNPDSVDDAVLFAGYLLKKTIEIDPIANVMFRVVFVGANGWENKFRNATYNTDTGELADPSFCDDDYWGVAGDCLDIFVKKLRMLPTAQHILGVHVERGEWFHSATQGYDTSKAALQKFRNWLRVRYGNDVVALRASWFDGSASFDTVTIPHYNAAQVPGADFVRTGRKSRRWVDYHLFLSDATVERIGELAHVVKKASAGYFLVGVSYGYTFEWSHASSGHLSLGKLLRTPEVDIVAGPPSYKNREPGGSCPFPGPIDSFALNGKLYVSEEDFKTPISGKQEPDDFNPVIRTPQALESAQWRGAGAALAHGSGVAWMDLWGNGWLNSTGIWHRGGKTREALIRRLSTPFTAPDVAVFIDERSLAYLADQKAFELLVQQVRESVLRSGVSVGFYLLSDLAHRETFPESKLYVFVNAWDIRAEVRAAIRQRLQRDNKVLFWLYAAGLFDAGRDSLERVREVTGIALKPQPFSSRSGTTMLHRRHPLCEALPERVLAHGSQLEPSYFALPEDGTVLGEYSQTGLPSFVVREMHNTDDESQRWTSVFLGEPVVTPALFRALAAMAGVQAWNYHDDLIHVRPPFLSVHCANAGTRSLTLPEKWAAYNLTQPHWVATDSTHLRFNALDGSTHVFLVGPQAELESIVEMNWDGALVADDQIQKSDNTAHSDSLAFDVPIMKLDEWMEEAWTEELADDLLLKPSQLEVEMTEDLQRLDQSKTTSRRRRRRRRSDQDFDGVAERYEELDMKIVFRKKD